MRKLIAAINVTLDGYCDHTTMVADDEIHQHYNELLESADTMVWGRITYQLMEDYWPSVVAKPTGNKQTDDFAVLADNISKVVFSSTLAKVEWKNTTLAKGDFKEEILKLKQQPGKDILVGSPSLIVAALNRNLVDELQLTVQPIIVGKGLPLLKNIKDRIDLKLLKTKKFKSSGSVTIYLKPKVKTSRSKS